MIFKEEMVGGRESVTTDEEQLNVPTDLQAILIRPYLSDRAKLLMSKCDPTHSAKYESIKVFYLKSYICLQQYTWRNLIL